MRHIDSLGSQFSVSIPPDEDGLIGRGVRRLSAKAISKFGRALG
jgi:hypothetical protein